ncbi:NAD(P)/FAD-dependent oxidoreductase [Pedobacter sandarakinus]|uniref:NAD(P)/FAD-dependent oxidoreductase n=1 Tax=Pedobacter sandarakinus TaxID=353156 RepID=UPI00224523BF|nr:FAD-dependent oxidoreductase [Pedobacter sandarakinus]MCX2573744.1 FAD-dependent oxidoreductase [Pedobacter sandarakinus]
MQKELSYWEKESFFRYDVIVIGSGIVGLTAAIALKQSAPNLSIAILERGFLPTGASTKNAGFACFGSISELIEQEKLGLDELLATVEKRWKGLLKLRAILGDERLDYQRLGGFELFKKEDKIHAAECVSKIEHFNQLLKSVVGESAYALNNETISSFGFDKVTSLIENRYEAQIDSGKMMLSLLQYAQQLGVLIFNGCEVNQIDDSTKQLVTANGIFKFNRLIVATNAFIDSLIKGLPINPGRGQVLITKPIKNLKVAGTFHYNRGFYYFRNINGRILLGGGRNLDFSSEETTTFGQTPTVQNALETLLKEVIIPKTSYEIDYRWSGIMAFGNELPPLVKAIHPDIFCATRCNGMGVAIGAETGTDIANLVLQSL